MHVQGLLLDIDGTLAEAERALPGAVAAVVELRRSGFPLRFVTNTTRRPRREIRQRLAAMGIDAGPEEIFTPPLAAVAWLEARGLSRIAACVPPATLEDFAGFALDDRQPQAVLVGDLGREWNFDRANAAFRWLLGGAELVALHRNRYWSTADGLAIDAGAWVVALEYASGKSGHLMGKPAHEFFARAAESMGLALAEVAMVGDDVASDVGGAQRAGARGILVRTGKFLAGELDRSGVLPDLTVVSIADLPASLERITP